MEPSRLRAFSVAVPGLKDPQFLSGKSLSITNKVCVGFWGCLRNFLGASKMLSLDNMSQGELKITSVIPGFNFDLTCGGRENSLSSLCLLSTSWFHYYLRAIFSEFLF